MKKVTLLLMMAATVALVACGKGNSGSSNNNPYYGGGGIAPGCTNCIGTVTPLLVGIRGSHSAAEVALDVMGDLNRMYQQGINPNDPYAVTRYIGPAQIVGYAMFTNVCPMMFGVSGEYYLQTRTTTTITLGAMSGGLSLLATPTSGSGPTIQLQVGSATFSAAGGLYRDNPNNRVGMNFDVYVNGQWCDRISTY